MSELSKRIWSKMKFIRFETHCALWEDPLSRIKRIIGTRNRTYLDSTFREADFHGYLLPEEDVRIVGPIETPFELVQLGRCEPRSVPFLLGRLVIALPDRCRVPCNDDLFLDKQRQLIINWLIWIYLSQFPYFPFNLLRDPLHQMIASFAKFRNLFYSETGLSSGLGQLEKGSAVKKALKHGKTLTRARHGHD